MSSLVSSLHLFRKQGGVVSREDVEKEDQSGAVRIVFSHENVGTIRDSTWYPFSLGMPFHAPVVNSVDRYSLHFRSDHVRHIMRSSSLHDVSGIHLG